MHRWHREHLPPVSRAHYPSIDPLMAHGHTLTAVAALHPVFSSPDTAAQVSEPEQWPETAEVGVPEVRGSAAATSPYSILIEAPCGQITPHRDWVCSVLHTGRICSRSLNRGVGDI